MKITPAMIQREFIGLKAKVVRSSNPCYLGICGKVTDETQRTVKILHKGREKVVVKQSAVFHFTLADGSLIEIDGKVLLGRPEDRVKKVTRRRW